MNYLNLLEEKEGEFAELFARMDADRDQVYATGYTLRNAKNQKAKDAYHVNLLDALHFVNKAISRLCSVSRQTLVESENMDGKDIELVEHFLDDLQFEADARLMRKGEMDAFTQHAELVCVRGPTAEQILLRLEKNEIRNSNIEILNKFKAPISNDKNRERGNGEGRPSPQMLRPAGLQHDRQTGDGDAGGLRFVPDVRPIDARYLLYELDADGIRWAAPFYQRRAADIESEYGVQVSGKTGKVQDYWDNEVNAVFVDGKQVFENPNPYGFVPFCISLPPTTTALRDEDSLKYKGDSILHLCRGGDGTYLYDERNFIASILKTQAAETLKPPLQKKPKADGETAVTADHYPASGEVMSTDSEITAVPKPDVRLSTQMYAQMVDGLLSQATFSALDYGTIDLPLSAVAITRIQEGKNEILLPRLNCLAELTQASARMKIRQATLLGQTIELGEEGRKRKYVPADLEGEYTIKYRFYTTSQEQLASAAAIAHSLGDLVDDEFKLGEILKLQNPAEMLSRRDAEAARKNNPAVLLFEQVMALIEEQEEAEDATLKQEIDLKARLQLRQLISILRQREASENVPLDIARDKPLGKALGAEGAMGAPGAKGTETAGVMPVFGPGTGGAKKKPEMVRARGK